MNQSKRIQTILKKLQRLQQKDSQFKYFGASHHRYTLNKPIDEKALQEFEDQYRIHLPEGYRAFLCEAGNGGAGPFYGILPLERVLYADIDRPDEKEKISPGLSFVYTEPWNRDICTEAGGDEKKQMELEEQYFDVQHINGCIRICNYGCGNFISLVVNGSEYGHVWADDRISDNGIYPFLYEFSRGIIRYTFLDWYEEWLDHYLSIRLP
jgi:hypothetical protein